VKPSCALATALVLAGLVAAPVSGARAAVGVRMPLADLLADSVLVVRGTVEGATAFLDDQTGRVFTRHTVRVSETFKGTRVETVTVVTMGGELPDIGQLVPGEARLAKGEDVVVCLKQDRDRDYYVTAMAQGKFSVVKRDGAEVLVRDLKGLLLLGEKGKGQEKEEISLPDFRKVLGGVVK